MPTYTVGFYADSPNSILPTYPGATFTWTGAPTQSGTATITDTEPGAEGETLDDDYYGESATADVSVGWQTSTGSNVDAERSWTVRDTNTGETFQVVELDVEDGAAAGRYTLSERPFDPDTAYEVVAYDSIPDVRNGDPVFNYDEYIATDQIVEGTSGDDTIDSGYTDPGDGDVIDGGDGQGPAGHADVVHAGHGQDSIVSGLGDDTVLGQAGDDTVGAGPGNDVIHGDHGPPGGAWHYEVYDRDFSSADGQAPDIESGTRIDNGFTDGFDSTALVQAARGDYSDPSDFGMVYTSTLAPTQDGTYTFATTSDDGSTIRILDSEGTPLQFLNQDGKTADYMNNDQHQPATTRSGEVELTAGETYTIEVRHWENQGQEVLSGTVTAPGGTTTSLHDSPLIAGPPSGLRPSGNDLLAGGSGDDTILGEGGDDTVSGGTGDDSLSGGAGEDLLTIAEGDTAAGGAGDDTFVLTDFGEAGSGTIDITGGEDGETAGDTLQLTPEVSFADITFTNTDDTAGGLSGNFALADGTQVNFSEIENIICFTPGTGILTETGERAVETLRPGDRVVTRDHGLQPLRWIGRRSVAGTGRFAPIEIAPEVLSGARRPLLVSPQHRVLFGGFRAELLFGAGEMLVAARHLLGTAGVRERACHRVSYIHLMFDRHEVIYAEGAATESLHAGTEALSALQEPAREELFALFPALRSHAGAHGPTARPCAKAHEARLLAA